MSAPIDGFQSEDDGFALRAAGSVPSLQSAEPHSYSLRGHSDARAAPAWTIGGSVVGTLVLATAMAVAGNRENVAVRGRVQLSPEDRPLPHVHLAVTAGGGRAVGVESDGAGAFEVRGPKEGLYRILDVTHPELQGRVVTPRVFKAEAGRPLLVSAWASAAIDVHVLDVTTLQPIPGAEMAEGQSNPGASRSRLLPRADVIGSRFVDGLGSGAIRIPIGTSEGWIQGVVSGPGHESRWVVFAYEIGRSYDVGLMPAGRLRILTRIEEADPEDEVWLWRLDGLRDPVRMSCAEAGTVVDGIPVGKYGVALCRRADEGPPLLMAAAEVEVTNRSSPVSADLRGHTGVGRSDVTCIVPSKWNLSGLDFEVHRSLPPGDVITFQRRIDVAAGRSMCSVPKEVAQPGDYIVLRNVGFSSILRWTNGSADVVEVPEPVEVVVRAAEGIEPAGIAEVAWSWQLSSRETGNRPARPAIWVPCEPAGGGEWRLRAPRGTILVRGEAALGQLAGVITVEGRFDHRAPEVSMAAVPTHRVGLRLRRGDQFFCPELFQVAYEDEDGSPVLIMSGGGPVFVIEHFEGRNGQMRILAPAGLRDTTFRIPLDAKGDEYDVDVGG